MLVLMLLQLLPLLVLRLLLELATGWLLPGGCQASFPLVDASVHRR